jgi:hypothetical protein
MNFHLPLVFDDGVKWIVRIRKNKMTCPKREYAEMDVISEVASLKAMRKAGICVPDAWCRPANPYSLLVASASIRADVSYSKRDRLLL